MEVDKLLLDTLDDLSEESRDKFVFYLQRRVLETCDPIAKSRLENIKCVKIVEKMVEKYGSDKSVELMIAILHTMGLNGEEGKLKKKYDKVRSQLASGAASSGVAPSSAPGGERSEPPASGAASSGVAPSSAAGGDRSQPPASGAVPHVSATALDGGKVNAPVITGCTMQGPMTLTFN